MFQGRMKWSKISLPFVLSSIPIILSTCFPIRTESNVGNFGPRESSWKEKLLVMHIFSVSTEKWLAGLTAGSGNWHDLATMDKMMMTFGTQDDDFVAADFFETKHQMIQETLCPTSFVAWQQCFLLFSESGVCPELILKKELWWSVS